MSKRQCGFAEVLVRLNYDMKQSQSLAEIGKLINEVFSISDDWVEFHKKHVSKDYTFTNLIDTETNNVLPNYKKGKTAIFRVYSTNYDLLSLIERKILKSSAFGVRDVVLDTKYFNYPVESLQVKNPVLMYDKPNKEIIVLKQEHTLDEKKDYLKRINEKLVSSYNFMKNKNVPTDFETFSDITNVRVAHVDYNDTVLVGTKGLFKVVQSEQAQDLMLYAFESGLGNKSALLGTGSSIPHFVKKGTY